MRFHALMLLRDEIDIVAQSLDHLLSWADAVYLLDMGSVDGTWDVVMDYARRDPRVVPLFSRPIVFDDNLRGMLFEHFRDRMEPGDWVLRTDTDEFYHVTPPRFVAERMSKNETAAHLQWYYFRLTQQEAADYESGKVDVMQDRQRPLVERRRYYKLSVYSEPRMFKYRRTIRWPQMSSFPFHAGFTARQRLPIRHYPHRDPIQMQRRFQLRANMMKLQAHAGGHWHLEDWRKELVDAGGNVPQSPGGKEVGLASQRGVNTGPLYYWAPGTQLPEVQDLDHFPSPAMRLVQRAAHRLLLPILDRRRAHYDRSYQPTPLPPEMVSHMYE